MNYLAHSYLADNSAESLIGNLLGDFVKGRLDHRYSPGVTAGIRLHRKTDSFTDKHSRTLQSRDRISPQRRRFAGIIVDLCYDHFLARHWDRFSDVALCTFISTIYDTLMASRSILPARLRAIVPHMVDEDWLGSYLDLEGIALALDRVSMRLKRQNGLAGAIEEVKVNYVELETDFLVFFPELVEYTEAVKAKLCNIHERR